MMIVGLNTWNAVTDAAESIPAAAIIGGLVGYGYAKFAHLPASQAAKGWAIWYAASAALDLLVIVRFEKPISKLIGRAIVLNISTILGIQQLQQRGLIGEKMRILYIATAACFTVVTSIIAITFKTEIKKLL